MKLSSLVIFAASAACTQCSSPLAPWAYNTLPVGSFQPQGWLLKELEIQANGLSGHLSLFWPDVANSSWVGGAGDTGLRERAPYWLNGMVPLSFLLPNSTTSLSSGVNLQQQAFRFVSYILQNQSSSGWLGPVSDISDLGGDMYWARYNVLNALRMYCEGLLTNSQSLQQNLQLSPQEKLRNENLAYAIKSAMLRFVRYANYLMNATEPLADWSAARYMDYILSIHWLIDSNDDASGWKANQSVVNFLYQAANLAHAQGFAWEEWFANKIPTQPVPEDECDLQNHGVNVAQALKSAGVWYRQTWNQTLREMSETRMDNMDKYHGQATGMFGADEHLAGRMPSRGTELCTVVEAMFSYAIMFKVFGEVRYLDRLERIAMNALPATFASPSGGDMWAHQYLQQNNEINSIYSDPHVWASDGPNATIYGLEPNYGCCTANFNQGWPKYTFSVFFTANNGTEAAIGIYAPGSAQFAKNIGGGAKINISTNYPFEDDIYVIIENSQELALQLRVPGWTDNATIILNQDDVLLSYNETDKVKGTMFRVIVPAASGSKNELYINFNPKFRLYSGFNQSVAVLRGSLLFSLPVGEMFQTIAVHPYQSRDYEIYPQTSWNYALMISDFNDLEKDLKYVKNGYVVGHAPFNRSETASQVVVKAVSISNWNISENAAESPPISPVCTNNTVLLDWKDDVKFNKNYGGQVTCGIPTQITLVPHGCTDLRIAEFPLAYSLYPNNASFWTQKAMKN